jgi:hypothetical protein
MDRGWASSRPGAVLCHRHVSVVLSACVGGCFNTGSADVDRNVPAAPLPSRPQVKAMLAGVMAAAVTVISANIHCVYVCACLSTANSSVADAGVSAALPPSCSLLQVMAMLAGAMAAAVCVISANQCIHEGLSALLTKQERVEGGGC